MAKERIVLTECDRMILESMRGVTQGLGAYLGEGCELILHSLESYQSSAIEVVNGFHSGRQVGAPITNLALKMLEDIECSGEQKAMTYFNKNKNRTTLKSATIPIIGEHGRIIGLLCINFYTDISMQTFLSSFLPTAPIDHSAPSAIEKFSPHVDDLISEAVAEVQAEIADDSSITAHNKNKEIVIQLEKRGIFSIKDSVVLVAQQLGVSKNTVYMHLRNLRK